MRKSIFIIPLLALFGLSILDHSEMAKVSASVIPAQLNNLVIKDIEAGTNHNLALDQDGHLWAWGNNDHGQLGDGTTNNSNVPIQIMRGHKFIKISAGNDCSAAIDEEGYLYGWGSTINPTGNDANVPTLVSATNKYRDVKCSYEFTAKSLVTDTSMDSFYGYGSYYSSVGSLKDSSYPAFYYSSYREMERYGNPDLIDNSKQIVCADGNFYYFNSSLSSLYYHDTFFVQSDGTICHRSGSKNTTAGDMHVHIFFNDLNLSALDEINIKDVSVRKIMDPSKKMNSTAYFVASDGKVFAVGYNGTESYLGNDDTSTEAVVSPIEISSLSNIKKVSAGKNHVLALDKTGKVYSWGINSYGQLGDGTILSKTAPTIISDFIQTQYFRITAFSGEENGFSVNQFGANNYQVKDNPSKGTLIVDSSSGECLYTPESTAIGNDLATISMSYSGFEIDYDIQIFIDRKPIFKGGTPSLNVECGDTIDGNAPAIDPDGDTLVYSIYQQPSKGTLTLTDNQGSFTYTARTDVAGGDSFVIGVSDGYCTIQYPVTVHIHSLITFDDDTDIELDLHSTNEYTSNVNATDIDGDILSYLILQDGVKGSVNIDTDGNYTYTANGHFYGEDTFVIRVDDGYKPLDISYTVHLFDVSDNGTSLFNKIKKGAAFEGEIKTNANGATPVYSIYESASNGSVNINEETGKYTYIPNSGSLGDDYFIVLIDYGYGQYTITIHVYQNTVPSYDGVVVSFITNENENYNGTAECVDADGDILTYSINTQPSKASLSINPTTGAFTYHPNLGVAGDDSFKIDVLDGTEKVTITFLVHIESKITVESDIYKTISQNTSLNGSVDANDKDGDNLIYSIDSPASNGIANIDTLTGNYIYIPFNNYYGSDSFVIKIDDGVFAKLCTVHVMINRRPIADQITMNLTTKGVTVIGTAKCTDPDGDALTYSIVQEPTKGSAIVDLITGSFAYTPNMGVAGDDTFVIRVTDGVDDILITVNIHNETDVELENQETTIVVNQGKSTNGQIHAVDLDGDALTYSIVNYPTQGTVNLNVNTGSWTYNAKNNATGTDSFSAKVTDGQTEVFITYSLLINTPASFDEDAYSIYTDENNNYAGQVTAIDADGDSLTFSVVSQGQKGTVSIDPSTGRYLYSPSENESGNDMFVIGVSDGNFVSEIEVYVHIESDISIPSSTIIHETEKNGVVVGNINATDPDGDLLTYAIYQQGQKGTATVMGDGGYSYFANDGAGDDSFVISVTDGTHTKYVTINVHISTKPYFEDDSITISVPQSGSVDGQVHGADEDGDQLSYSLFTQPEHGYVNLNSISGKFTYSAYSNSTASSDCFVVAMTDGTDVSYITVNVIVNNPPLASDEKLSINQGGSGNGCITASDPEGDNLVYSISSQGLHGEAYINSSTGEYTYTTNDKTYFGQDTFVITVTDGYSYKRVLVDVTIVKNKAPISQGLSIEVNSGGSASGVLDVFDSDSLKYSISSQGIKGTAHIEDSSGHFTYVANPGSYGEDCFVISVTDGYNTCSYLVQVKINYIDMTNYWAIPTIIGVGSAAVLAVGILTFILIRTKKKYSAK